MDLTIAVTTGTLYPEPTLQAIEALASLGVRDVELVLQRQEFSLTFERRMEYRIQPALEQAVAGGQLRVCSVHAPVMPAEQILTPRDRLVTLRAALETAAALRARILVVHPFHLVYDQPAVLAWAAAGAQGPLPGLLPGLDEVLLATRACGLRLALENIQMWADEPFFNTPSGLACFLQAVGSPVLGLTLDLFHAAVTGQLDLFLDLLPRQIFNVHLADYHPDHGRVLPGQGTLDWTRIGAALRAMPNLSQVCLELYHPSLPDLAAGLAFARETIGR